MITLQLAANERGTYVIPLAFSDVDGSPVTPIGATWTLTDPQGVVINGREDVDLEATDAAATIVLSGADLANATSGRMTRCVTVVAPYNSVTYGDDLQMTEEFRFTVLPLAGVS